MATNLRLRPDVAAALKSEAVRSGRTQQDVLRAAVDSYLRNETTHEAADQRISVELLLAPRTPLTRPARRITLAKPMTSADLIDREDRF